MLDTRIHLSILKCLLAVGLCVLLLAACGGGDDEAAVPDSTPAASGPAVPTMPPARFAQPTSVIDKTKIEQDADESAGPNLELGERVYTKHCTECHGNDGAGVADKGGSLAGTLTTEPDFDDLLRTGGELGPTHQFGPTAISPTGMEALYAYTEQLVAP